MNAEQLEALYGPLFPHSDHKTGERVRFYDVVLNSEQEGIILWVQAPGPTHEGGKVHPCSYIMDKVDPSTGFLWQIEPSDIVER
jgi:hypothetical protein